VGDSDEIRFFVDHHADQHRGHGIKTIPRAKLSFHFETPYWNRACVKFLVSWRYLNCLLLIN